MTRNIIVAYDNERGIGIGGHLPWKNDEMKDDMEHFRAKTMNHSIIMGRKTLESIGIALSGRRNIVLTKSENSTILVPGVEVVHSLDEAFDITSDDKESYVIGGGSLYEEALEKVDRIYATEVDANIPGVDTYFPQLDSNWTATEMSERHPADSRNIYPYTFVTYQKGKNFVNLKNARFSDQLEVMERIAENQECPFCQENLEKYHKKELLRRGENWLITYNQWPYENTQYHFLAIANYHAEKVSDLRPGSFDELLGHISWLEEKFGFKSGGLCMRFGDVSGNGASVRHLHAHIIIPEKDLPKDRKVRFKIS